VLIYTTLASSTTLKSPDEGGMVGPGNADGIWRPSSLSLATAIAATANSMLFYSQSSARCALASIVMTSAGLGILSLM
jgi:hypothetical protein